MLLGSENPIASGRKLRHIARSEGGGLLRCPGVITMTLGEFFDFNVMLRPSLGIIPSFFTNFQLPEMLHRGGAIFPLGDTVKTNILYPIFYRYILSFCDTEKLSKVVFNGFMLDDGLNLLRQLHRNLKHISLTNCYLISDVGWKIIGTFPNLTNLTVKGGPLLIHFMGLTYLSTTFRKLHEN